jgi:hypothetical protein
MHAVPSMPDRLRSLFAGDGPEQQYLRSLCTDLLNSPQGVPGSGIPYSVDFGRVNSSPAAFAYMRRVHQGDSLLDEKKKPSAILQDPRYSRYFAKAKSTTVNTGILTFAPGVLGYLLGRADAPPPMPASYDSGGPGTSAWQSTSCMRDLLNSGFQWFSAASVCVACH